MIDRDDMEKVAVMIISLLGILFMVYYGNSLGEFLNNFRPWL